MLLRVGNGRRATPPLPLTTLLETGRVNPGLSTYLRSTKAYENMEHGE